jgi:hypothetical protein
VESAVLNIFDLMGASQGGSGLDAMARQFGLTQDQAQRAFAALMPAFALGLQRNAATPDALGDLMRMMGAGQPAPQPQGGLSGGVRADPPPPQPQGDEALGRLFGPPELTRQIAEQAAHWSGVSATVLQQMMPIFAAALVASLSKFSEVMRAQAGGAPTPGPTPAQPHAAWAEMMSGFMGAGGSAPPTTQPGGASAPRQDAAPKPEPQAEPRPAEPPSSSSNDELQAAWSGAVESGREAQAQYIATLQNIFDQFWGARPDRR